VGGAPVDLLDEVYGLVTRRVEGLGPRDFLAATRAAGWTVQDLLFHQMLDAARALRAFASPTDQQPDVDEVTYWRAFHPDEGDGGLAHARYVRISSSADSDPAELVWHWRETAESAVRAAAAAPRAGRVRTQGHVLTVADFTSTLVVEAAVHYLDLTVELPGDPLPDGAVTSVRRVLDGLLGTPAPERWGAVEHMLKGTGRQPLTDDDRADLGAAADRFPLFG